MIKHLSEKLQLSERSIQNTIELLDEGCTIPFIARYRKERTGSLDEVQIAAISDLATKWREMEKRKEQRFSQPAALRKGISASLVSDTDIHRS